MDDLILGIRRAEKSVWDREDAKSNGFRLSDGEPGYDKTNHIIKIGDGVSKFANLPSIEGGTSFDGGTINNNITILADSTTDLKYFGIQYLDETGANQHFRMSANNSSDYLSLTSSDSRIGTIIAIKYDGTAKMFLGTSNLANRLSTSRTITFLNDLSGSFSFDGSSDVDASVFVKNHHYVTIEEDADLNDIIDPGWYRCDSNSVASTVQNCPTSTAFALFVNSHAGTNQIVISYQTTNYRVWIRNKYSKTWGDWKVFYTSDNPPNLSILPGTLPITKGGTGGTTASSARTNLSVPYLSQDTSDFWGIMAPNEAAMSYLRVPSEGIIPWSQNSEGIGTVGTSSWPFSAMYAKNGYFSNITSGERYMKIGNYQICCGSFSTGTYSTTGGVGNNAYADISVSGSYTVAFSENPFVIMSVVEPTTGVLNVEPIMWTPYSIAQIRIHRASSGNDFPSFDVHYIVMGPALS